MVYLTSALRQEAAEWGDKRERMRSLDARRAAEAMLKRAYLLRTDTSRPSKQFLHALGRTG